MILDTFWDRLNVKLLLSQKSVRDEDLHKTYHPIPVMNAASLTLGVVGLCGPMLANFYSHVGVFTAFHRNAVYCTLGVYLGYWCTKVRLKSKMGQVKYALDYMERHKEEFPEKAVQYYGDPTFLVPFQPKR